MDLNSTAIHDVIHPTAAFSHRPHQAQKGGDAAGDWYRLLDEPDDQPWVTSQLNPKNRIDSLEPPADPLWRIDGCTALGTQYYAVPTFLENVPPLRIDVFIPEEAMTSPLLRRLLDLDVAFHAKNSTRLRRLGICSHILRALQHWTTAGAYEEQYGNSGCSRERVARMFWDLPFGSRILFRNLDVDVRRIRIEVLPMHEAERELLSASAIRDRWRMGPDEALPPAVDLHKLAFLRQLHDSVCLVRLREGEKEGEEKDREGGTQIGNGDGELHVMKALTSGSKYLYHELLVLLRLPPHPNIIRRPTHIVTKRCAFGNKLAVVGFLLPFQPGGNLTEEIPFLAAHGLLTAADRLRWARQTASAVVHAFEAGGRFYPDLRLDNVVFSSADPAARSIVLLDFEQRGVWCEFGSPEVNAVEYVRILATDDASGFHSFEPTIPDDVREKYVALLDAMLPGWQVVQNGGGSGGTGRPTPPYLPGADVATASFNIAWECLDAAEREAAQVYMLGRALWCLLEGCGAPARAAAWQSYTWEPALEFPAFRRTPPQLRPLLSRCTRGRRDQLSKVVVRRNSKMMLAATTAAAAGQGEDGSSSSRSSSRAQAVGAVLAAAREWWAEEIRYAEEFLRERAERKAKGTWDSNYFGRPKLREVTAALEAFEAGDSLPET